MDSLKFEKKIKLNHDESQREKKNQYAANHFYRIRLSLKNGLSDFQNCLLDDDIHLKTMH